MGCSVGQDRGGNRSSGFTMADTSGVTTDNKFDGTIRFGGLSFDIPESPIDIYKFRKDFGPRPELSVWRGEGVPTYIPQRFESIKGVGNFVYFYGVDLPSKCIAEDKVIYALNPVKRRFVNLLRVMNSMRFPLLFLSFMGKKQRKELLNKALEFFNQEADMTLLPYYLDDTYCRVVREIQRGISAFLCELGAEESIALKTAEIIGCMFEFDNAYRYRIQDVLNEANPKKLIMNFPKELKRLILLEREREVSEYKGVSDKFINGQKLLELGWHLSPKIKYAIREAVISMNWENVKLDEADIFHTLLFNAYNTQGKTLEERLGMYAKKYGEDPDKWPPRIIVRNK